MRKIIRAIERYLKFIGWLNLTSDDRTKVEFLKRFYSSKMSAEEFLRFEAALYFNLAGGYEIISLKQDKVILEKFRLIRHLGLIRSTTFVYIKDNACHL